MKSVKSEDLSKDLPRNLRISPQTQGFHDEMDEKRSEIEENDPTQICVQICFQTCVHQSPAFNSNTTSAGLSMSVRQTDCVKGNHCPDYHTDTQTKEDEHLRSAWGFQEILY